MLIRLLCWLLKHKKLSSKNRQLVLEHLLFSIDALPTRAIITVNEGKLFIRGAPVELEKAIALRDSAHAVLNNPAYRTVHEQVLYQAVSLGVHQAQTTEQIQFAKAAIWYGQQETEILQMLAQQGTNELLV